MECCLNYYKLQRVDIYTGVSERDLKVAVFFSIFVVAQPCVSPWLCGENYKNDADGSGRRVNYPPVVVSSVT